MAVREAVKSDLVEENARQLFWLLPHFHRWVQAKAFQDKDGVDLSIQQITVLYMIRTMGASSSEIAKKLMVAPTVVTGIIDRLERRGYVTREHDSVDRRRINLSLTELGLAVSQRVEEQMIADVIPEMSDLSEIEQRKLEDGLRILETVITRLEASIDGA